MNTKPCYSLSVRELAEAALPTGDLILRPGDARRLQEGSRLHREYQRGVEMPGYRSEVPVSYVLETPRLILEITGRIDGMLEGEDRVAVEELKTTAADPAQLAPDPRYWAQAMSYGAIWCLTHPEVEHVTLRLIYIRLDSGEARPLEKEYSAQAITEEFFALCRAVTDRLERRMVRCDARNEALEQLPFPFETFRPGQRDMAAAVWHAASHGEMVMIEAPTGIGKTMAALYPAVRALGQGCVERVFCLSARGTVKQVTEQSILRLLDAGAPLIAVTLTAKDKCCPTPGVGCHPSRCPRAAGFFDRLGAALDEMSAPRLWDAEAVADLAQRHALCPYELSLAMAEEADLILCDYNYAFDPRVHLRRFFEESGEHMLLVDECHNLVERARDMFSAQLAWDDVMTLKRALSGTVQDTHGPLSEAVSALQKAFITLRHTLAAEGGRVVTRELPEALLTAVRGFLRVAADWIDAGSREPFFDALTELYYRCRAFRLAADGFDACCTVLEEAHEPHVRVRIYCMDPSTRLRECYGKVRAACFFSATLTPDTYFTRMLGLDGAGVLHLPSPFPKEHLLHLTVTHLPTAYRRREESLTGLCQCLNAMVKARAGCYFAFFPSYQYMVMAHALFTCLYPDVEAPIQQQSMEERERRAFLERFEPEPGRYLLAFAVMGGLFSEGVDLVGDRLSGAAVISVGLPQMDLERDVLKTYHDELEEDGFSYAYAWPGFTRVCQAAGRVIRSEKDRGVLMLIDPRFTRRQYLDLYPETWQDTVFCHSPRDISDALATFWAGAGEQEDS